MDSGDAAAAEQSAEQAPQIVEMTLEDVRQRVQLAIATMSPKNPNRMLMANLLSGLIQLGTMVEKQNEKIAALEAENETLLGRLALIT